MPNKWLGMFIQQNDGSSDFNDDEEVMGWLTAELAYDEVGELFVITYKPDDNNPDFPPPSPTAVERYRITPVED